MDGGSGPGKKKSILIQAFSALRVAQKNHLLKLLKLQPKESDADFPGGKTIDSDSDVDDDGQRQHGRHDCEPDAEVIRWCYPHYIIRKLPSTT